MTLQLTLPQELEERLRREAERRGQGSEIVALRLLDEHLPPPSDERRVAAVAMLERWAEEDAAGGAPRAGRGPAVVSQAVHRSPEG